MSWADDFYAATYATTVSSIGNAGQIFYNKDFLKRVEQVLRMVPLGQPQPLPKYSGKTQEWYRYLNITPSVSSATLSEGVHPQATQFTAQKLQATIGIYGAFGQVTSLLKDTGIDPETAGAVGLFSHHAARIMDLLCHYEVVSNGGYPLRADLDTTAEFTGVVDSATTTTLVDANLSSNSNYGDANDDLNQSIVIITGGGGYGQSRAVTDYVTSTGTMTVSPAWDVTPSADDTFRVVTTDDISNSDKLTHLALKRGLAVLQDNLAEPDEDGYYPAIADPFILEALKDETLWTDLHKYQQGAQGIYKGEVGKFAGFRFIMENNPFRFPITTRGTAGTSYGPGATGANYSSSAAITGVPLIGRNAYGVTKLTGDKGTIDQPMVITKTPGPNSTDQPLDMFSTVGWKIRAVYKSLNPMFLVNVFAGSQV